MARAQYSSEGLVDVFLATLLEQHTLIVSSDVSKLLPLAAAISQLLSPLSFSGTFIPFFPYALHADPQTLVRAPCLSSTR